ncbi:MAG: ABC transporter permease [Burkholderiales bacterium]|nr:ABC transporter permease [Burkholderiales bacterium]MCE7901018.1 ABC transporter permease [Armatimonadetes bacterium ATM1]
MTSLPARGDSVIELTPANTQEIPARRGQGGMQSKAGHRTLVFGLRLLALVVALICWELVVRVGLIPEFYISRPYNVLLFLIGYVTGPQFVPDSMTTIRETLAGFVLGSTFGILGGLLLGRFTLLELVARPYVAAIQSLPKVALAPMFILWFGLGSQSKIFLGAVVVFFIVLVSTEAGVRAVERDILMTTRALAATNRQLYLKVVLPGSLPSVFAGLRLGAVYALLASIVGQMIAAREGWGLRITYYSQTFEAAGVFSILIIIGVFASAFGGILIYAERRLLRWQD